MKLIIGLVIGKRSIFPSQCCKSKKEKQSLNKLEKGFKVYIGNPRESREVSLTLRLFTLIPVAEYLIIKGGRLYLGSQFRRMHSIMVGKAYQQEQPGPWLQLRAQAEEGNPRAQKLPSFSIFIVWHPSP